MASREAKTVAPGGTRRRASSFTSAVILLIGNLIPLAGVLLWGWDAFLLLMLYWMETVIAAFWTMVRIARAPYGTTGSLENGRKLGSRITAVFFTVHSGLFIVVHLVFLWVLFSGTWPARTGGLLGFFRHAIFDEGLWLPLLFMFMSHGAFLLFGWLPKRKPMRPPDAAAAHRAAKQMGGIIVAFYGRIFVMQFVIIVGAWIAVFVSSMAPLVLLIVLKTVFEWMSQTGRSLIGRKVSVDI